MPQLHFYVPDAMAQDLRERAQGQGMSVSKYLASIVCRHLGRGWPAGYFTEVAGAWQGEPLERASQGEPEKRDAL